MSTHRDLYADMTGVHIGRDTFGPENDTQPDLSLIESDCLSLCEMAAITSRVKASGGSSLDAFLAIKAARESRR